VFIEIVILVSNEIVMLISASADPTKRTEL